MSQTSMIFADGLLDASVQHGVIRLTLGRMGPDNAPIPSGLLVLPLTQLGALTQALANLSQQIEARIKEAASSAEAAASPAMPGAFTFGGRG